MYVLKLHELTSSDVEVGRNFLVAGVFSFSSLCHLVCVIEVYCFMCILTRDGEMLNVCGSRHWGALSLVIETITGSEAM